MTDPVVPPTPAPAPTQPQVAPAPAPAPAAPIQTIGTYGGTKGTPTAKIVSQVKQPAGPIPPKPGQPAPAPQPAPQAPFDQQLQAVTGGKQQLAPEQLAQWFQRTTKDYTPEQQLQARRSFMNYQAGQQATPAIQSAAGWAGALDRGVAGMLGTKPLTQRIGEFAGQQALAGKNDTQLAQMYNEKLNQVVGQMSGQQKANINQALAGASEQQGGLWGAIKSNPALAALPLGLLGMFVGGRMGKVLGMLGMAYGGYSAYQMKQDLEAPDVKEALKAAGEGRDYHNDPTVLAAARAHAIQTGTPEQEADRVAGERVAAMDNKLNLVQQAQSVGLVNITGQGGIVDTEAQKRAQPLQWSVPEAQQATPVAPLKKQGSLEDADHLFNVYKAERAIFEDPSLTIFGKTKMLNTMENAIEAQPEPRPLITVGDVFKGAIGAGLGYGVATIASKFLGLSDSTKSTMQNLGMGLGTLLNIGNQYSAMQKRAHMNPIERDARAAFRLGAVQALADRGYFKTAGFTAALPINPELVTRPIEVAGSLTQSASDAGGSILGSMAAPSDADRDATRSEMEARALELQAGVLEGQRNNRLLGHILRKRLTAIRS